MSREMIKGVGWGVFVCALMVAVVSLIAPPPLVPLPADAVALATGAARGLDPAADDTLPDLAAAEVAVPIPPAPALPAGPEADTALAVVPVPAPPVGSAPTEPPVPATGASTVAVVVAAPAGDSAAAPGPILAAAADSVPGVDASPPAPKREAAPEVALVALVPAAPAIGEAASAPVAAADASLVPVVPAALAAADGWGRLPAVDLDPPTGRLAAAPELGLAPPVPAAAPAAESRAPALVATEDRAPDVGAPAAVARAPAADLAPVVGAQTPPVAAALAPGAGPAAPEPTEAAPLRVASVEGPETSDAPAPLSRLIADLPPAASAPVPGDLGLAPAAPAAPPPLDLAQAYPRRLPRAAEPAAPGPDPEPQLDPAAPTAEAAAEPAPAVAMPGKRVGRLPTLGEAAPAEPEPPADAAETPTGRAVVDNAVAFANPDGLPRLAVVLLDAGGAPMAPPAAPVTFAIDATRADAAEIAARYRDAGHEVVAMAPLPAGAGPADAAVALSGYVAALPGTVAVIEAEPGGLQPDRQVAAQVVAELARTGHGLIAWDSGLNQAAQVAARDGLPFGAVFRDLDGAGQDQAAIRRFLDQAAFRAAQSGGLIVVARARPATVAAIDAWLATPRAATVVLAPVSAVLTGG